MLKRLLPLLFILILTLAYFHQLAFTDKILARGDTYNYFYPYWDVRNEAFRHGELPLWTNDIFMGAPLLANPQIGTYYPPNWLTAPFRAPDAIRVSILMHIALAGVGMFALYRTVISKRILPAIASAVIFAFGGYVGSHVEQINQLQGLAWMPILFALYHRLLTGEKPLRDGLLLAIVWALQIFSGHTQTVFMSGVGLGLYGLIIGVMGWRETHNIIKIPRAIILLGVCAVIGVVLSIPQLLPTMELTGMSYRGGGFTAQQATAFSLSPNTIGRALLPSYDSQLFGEYVTYIGIIGLGLALWGMVVRPFNGITQRTKLAWIVIAVIGLLLAFGRYNPLYLLLAELPGFNLFRVPARWLSLFSIGMAILGGLGVDALVAGKRPQWQFTVIVGFALGALIVLTRFVLEIDPRDVYGNVTPENTSVALWVATLVILLAFYVIRHRWIAYIATGCLVLELFLASLILPYNDLTPPEVYLGQRFTISQLLAYQHDEIVTGRMLGISRLFFDPGDIRALRERYDRLGLDEQSQFHAFDAVKKQEMLMPNLPLTWGIPSMDGFGGGVLPTIYYSQFTSLMLPEGELRTVDGRIGEILAKPECRGACIPDLEWLKLTDTRYIITDKVYDMWHDDVAYDTTLAEFWHTTEALLPPEFDYNEVRILHSRPLQIDAPMIEIQDGLLVTITEWETLQDVLSGDHSIIAVTLVDNTRKEVFLQLQPPPFERILSSDIKIYTYADSQSRAYLARDTVILPDDWQGHEDALKVLQAGEGTVIHGEAEPRHLTGLGRAEVEFVGYTATRMELQVEAEADAYLIVSDAYFPGWKASVNAVSVPVYRANVMFRAVPVPAGESRVILEFVPDLWVKSGLIGGGMWVLMGLLVGIVWVRKGELFR